MSPTLQPVQKKFRLGFCAAISVFLAGAAIAHELTPLDEKGWDRDKAAHLLRRAGFGGTATEVDALFAKGIAQAVASLVDYGPIPYAPAAPAIDPAIREAIDRVERRRMDEAERQRVREERQRQERRSLVELRLWWIERLVESPRPLEEKLTLFWHGHFTSGAREVQRTWFLLEQNEFLRHYASATFKELLIGISKDRAMLVYLDNARNSVRSPNENYARELLELFTLGVGNYTEADIRSAARAFTGWSLDEEGFRFRPGEHDDGIKRFLGRAGALDGDDVIDIILEQPACSKFLARALLVYFVTPEPSREFVDRFAAEIRRNNYSIRPSLRTLFLSEGFYDEKHRGALIKSPVELLVSTARQLGVRVSDLPSAAAAMSEMGQELFQPPNVKGWVGGTKWINTATLFCRYNTVAGLIFGTERRGPFQRMMGGEEPAADLLQNDEMRMLSEAAAPLSRIRAGRQQPVLISGALGQRDLKSASQVVDFCANHFLAVPMVSEKRDALVRYLDGPDGRFAPADKDAVSRLRTMLHLLFSTPEFQVY